MTSREALLNIGYIDIDGRYPYPNYLKDWYKKEYEILEQLVERNTPKSPIKNTIHEITQYNCPVCVCRLDIPQLKEVNFCPKCGKRLDWSKSDD